MAQDEARAERIRALKAERPDLTWREIGEHVGVTERGAIEWQATGEIKYENAKKLAELFEVSVDYIWRGPEGEPEEVPDLMAKMNGTDRIRELEQGLAAAHGKLDHMIEQFDALLAALNRERAGEGAAGGPDHPSEPTQEADPPNPPDR